MKKTSFLFGSAVLLGTLVNVGTAFADTPQVAAPDSASTSVSTTLNAINPNTPKPPTDPQDPTNGGNQQDPNGVTGENGKLGIAYYPKSFTFSGSLGKEKLELTDISNSMSHDATYNIGVKDATRQKNQWTLTAKLNWANNDLPGSTIMLANTTGEVTQNTNDGTKPFQTNDLANQTDVQGTPNVVIKNTATEIMKKGNGTVGKGTYDYKLGSFGSLKLDIPNATNLEAKTYSGSVDWNLTITP